MRVNLATEVMSGNVAAAIYTHSITCLLPQEAMYAAEFVHEVDILFDWFNSARRFHFKEILGGMSHVLCHNQFINDITSYIKSWEVCAPHHVHIHYIDGWLINSAALKSLWQYVQIHKIKHLTR